MSRQDQIRHTPTASEKAALKGTRGSPSAANAFVTTSDPRTRDARTPTAHASAHEAEGEDPIGFHAFQAAAPPAGSPTVDGWWLQHDGGTPDAVSLRVRVNGVDTTIATWPL